jgi:hypothetical protein
MKTKSEVDREIAEGLEDLKKGRVYGPFKTAEEMIRFLHAEVKEHNSKRPKRK